MESTPGTIKGVSYRKTTTKVSTFVRSLPDGSEIIETRTSKLVVERDPETGDDVVVVNEEKRDRTTRPSRSELATAK